MPLKEFDNFLNKFEKKSLEIRFLFSFYLLLIFFKGLLFLELFQFPTCMTLLDFNTCYYKYLEYLEQIKEITFKKHTMLNTIIHKLLYYLSM